MKKEKGFTLIELLAVIVILAVIALIATPTILSIINRSRKGAAESSMLNYVETIEKELMLELVNDSSFTPGGTYTIQGKVLSKEEKEIQLELKGDTPKSDVTNTVVVDSIGQVVMANLKFGDYYVHYEFNENNATYCSNREAFKTCNGGVIATPTAPEETKYKAYKTGKTSEVSVIYFNPVKNAGCSESQYNIDTNNETLTVVANQTNGCMKWYAIENSGEDKSTVDVFLNHYLLEAQLVGGNSNGTYYRFEDISIVENALKSLTDIYNWKVTPRLISADEIAKITDNQSFKSNVNTYKEAEQFYFDTNTKNPNGTYGSQYSWLYDYSPFCKGCNLENKEYSDDYGEIWGYWTSSLAYEDDYKNYWVVYRDGSLLPLDTSNSDPGLRPVITIDKTKLN